MVYTQHMAGRPTDYNQTLVEEVKKYLKSTGRQQTELPTMEGLAGYFEVNTDTLVEWAKLYPAFSAAIKELKEKQKEQLMNDGLYGGKEVNSTMAIFLLKVNHGMIETEKKMMVGANGESLAINVLSYGTQDPISHVHDSLQLPTHSPNAGSVGGSSSLPSAQLASQSAQNDIGH